MVTVILFVMLMPVMHAEQAGDQSSVRYINNWLQRWQTQSQDTPGGQWTSVRLSEERAPELPSDAKSVWIRFDLPPSSEEESLFIPNLYAKEVSITMNGTLVYHSSRSYSYDKYRIVTALPDLSNGGEVMIHAETDRDRAGLSKGFYVGPHESIEQMNARANIRDIVLGGGFIFVSLVMYACMWFLKRNQWGPWLSLSTMILSIGVMMITYAPSIYMYFNSFGEWFYQMFDTSLVFFLPALTYFFEQIFGPGKYRFFTRFRKAQIAYSLFLCAALVTNILTDGQYFSIYYFFAVTVLGIIMIIQFPLILIATIVYAKRGNKDAGILAAGIGAFAVIGTGELIWFYMQEKAYDLYLWKLGIVLFIGSLIILLGRRMADNHKKVIQYSKELHEYIGKMQHSEKIGAIHELAPSIAQEVNEPLGKTKELLLQIAGRAEQARESGHIKLAIEELERASSILSNYFNLMDGSEAESSHLHIREELEQVSDIVQPFAMLQGGFIELDAADNLYGYGNRDQFRQSLLNLIKNGLEALDGEGRIRLSAYLELDSIVILVADNGRGMDEQSLNRLGNPYFTAGKANGTGLGLMTTFQLIERMNGTLSFTSTIGEGTTAWIRIPAAADSKAAQ